jgi:dihydroorotate dehydrogenase
MYRLIRRLLFLLPAEAAHHVALWALSLLEGDEGLCRWLRRRALPRQTDRLTTTVAGLTFPNPVLLAAGLDKDGEAIPGLFALGFGGVEVGTVTPRPQPGNPRPRLFRLSEQRALINRMGFNNQGAQHMATRLRGVGWRPAPLGINVGKNKDTPLADAVADYLACVDALAPLADYVVVNLSSPNTPGLRQLQEPAALADLLRQVRGRVGAAKPLFLKIAPDLAREAIESVVEVAMACKVDALIATNTTITRPVPHARAHEAGGLSGAPLRDMSTQVIRIAYASAQGRLPIIGVGGVFSAEDAYAKIRAGASLVQIYTGFIYEGPSVVARIARELDLLLARDGFASVAAAVGADVANHS